MEDSKCHVYFKEIDPLNVSFLDSGGVLIMPERAWLTFFIFLYPFLTGKKISLITNISQ